MDLIEKIFGSSDSIAYPVAFFLGLPLLCVLMVYVFNAIVVLVEDKETQDLSSFLQFCNEVEERRFRFWVRAWFGCGAVCAVFYSVHAEMFFMAQCMMTLICVFFVAMFLYQYNFLHRLTVARICSLAHLFYILAGIKYVFRGLKIAHAHSWFSCIRIWAKRLRNDGALSRT